MCKEDVAQGKREQMGREKESKRKELNEEGGTEWFPGAFQLLFSFSGEGGLDVHQRLAQQTSREEGKPRASSSSFPLSSCQEGICLAVGRGGPSSVKALRVGATCWVSPRENLTPLLGPGLPAFRCCPVLRLRPCLRTKKGLEARLKEGACRGPLEEAWALGCPLWTGGRSWSSALFWQQLWAK